MTTFKKWLKATAAVLSLAALVGVVYGFATSNQPVKKEESPRLSFQQWHQISITPNEDPEDQAYQELSADSIATPPALDAEGCAQQLNQGSPCAVLLEVPTADYKFTSPATMSSLPSGVEPVLDENDTPIYARQPAD